MHRPVPIGMAQRATERLDIGGKARFTCRARSAVHSGPPIRMKMRV
jgi:hypothetical protein